MNWHPAYIEAHIRELFLKGKYLEIESPDVRRMVRARMALPPFYREVLLQVLTERRSWIEIAEGCDTYPWYVKRVYFRAMDIVWQSILRQERKGW